MSLPRTCIIGAGTSGLICAKVLKQHRIPFDCLEKGSGLGGIWRFKNDNGVSTCYRSLHINTSKRLMELSDFKFLDTTAEYPSHREILAEFERYADHFDVRRHISFATTVDHCERIDDGRWRVGITGPGGSETRDYDFLVVANGHHWDPRMVEFPGHFHGLQLHSHHYVDVTDPYDLRDKNVVVVGMGNSAMDIACELGHVGQGAAKVFLSQRSGVWIIPKIFGNTPQDKLIRHPMVEPSRLERFIRGYVPRRPLIALSDWIMQTIVRFTVGHPSRVGLKPPREPFHMRHPTVSQEIHNRLIHGDVIPKGNIKKLRGDRVEFEDGSVEDVDAVIYATGYNITFPFFDRGFISAPNNEIGLFQRIFDARFNNLAFIALVQPLCAMMPIAELQSQLLAAYMTGRYHLPASHEIQAAARDYDDTMKSLYTKSLSHTIQIECTEYSFLLREEWKRGAERARNAGNTLPVKSGQHSQEAA